MRKGMASWSLLNIYAAMLLALIPGPFKGISWWVDFALLLSCLLEFVAATVIFRVPLRLPVAGVLVAIFMTWAAATTLVVNTDIGRSLYSPIQYYTCWGFFCVMLYASLEIGVYLAPGLRRWVVIPFIGILLLSGIVGLAQWLGSGFARSLSPGLFGSEALFRPSGLTDYTFVLGAHCVLGAMLIASRLVYRDLKLWEWGCIGFFVAMILVAQYRSLYYAGIPPIALALLILQSRRDRRKAVLLGLSGVAMIAVLLLAFPSKFTYGLRGATNDPALAVRYKAWEQVGPVIAERPLTGIGADQSLMISTGLSAIDKYSGTTIDNFYRMVLICHGYVGSFLVILCLAAIGFGLIMRYDGAGVPEVKAYSLAGFVFFIALLVVSTTGNSFIYRSVCYPLAIVLALGASTWQERRHTEMVSPLTAWARTVAHSPLRALFPGLSRIR